MVNMGELFDYPRITNVAMERVPLSKREANNYLLDTGDLLFARQSLVYSGAGKCSIFLGAPEPVTFEGHLIRARLDPGMADPSFYFYFFNSTLGRKVIGQIIEQVSAAGIRGSDLSKLEVPYPVPKKQHAIGALLAALDDKIELSRRMNHTLEAIARALFKSWFVDFDPVLAKAKGEQPYGLDADIAALFPDAFVASELGMIPEGWRVGTVGRDFSITMGQSPPGDTYNEEGQGPPFYQGRRDFGFRYPSVRVFCSAPTRFAKAGDTLVSVRAPVGDINMAHQDCCVGRGVSAVRHKTGSRSYTYYAMQSLKPLLDRFEAEGTVFGSLNKRDFHNLTFLIPPQEVVRDFEMHAFPVDQLIEVNEQQSATLAELRDILLPKLISGELRVPEAEEMVEEAT